MADALIVKKLLSEGVEIVGEVKSYEDLEEALNFSVIKLDTFIPLKELEVFWEITLPQNTQYYLLNLSNEYFVSQIREVKEQEKGKVLRFWKEDNKPLVADPTSANYKKGRPQFFWLDPPLLSDPNAFLNYYAGKAHLTTSIYFYPVPDKDYNFILLLKILPLKLNGDYLLISAVVEKYYPILLHFLTAELFRKVKRYEEADKEEAKALQLIATYKKAFSSPAPPIVPLKFKLFKRLSDS